MPFDKKSVPKRLIDAVRTKDAVFLIGAGISKQSDPNLPNWNQLLTQLIKLGARRSYIGKADKKELLALLKRERYLMAAEEVRNRFPPDEYESALEELFNPIGVKPSKVHEWVFKLGPSLVMTTNYDRFLEDAYAEKFRRAPNVKTYAETPTALRHLQRRGGGDVPMIFKLHGTIDDPKSVILTEQDYRRLIYREPGYRHFLSALFLTRVILMLGFSLDDPELMLLMEDLRESLKHRTNPDYAFMSSGKLGKVEAGRWREDYGVQIIPYEPTAGHPEVLQFLKYLKKAAAK